MPAEVTTPTLEPLAVSIAGAARLLSISESHFYQLQRGGKFGPAGFRLGRSRRFLISELRAWVEAGAPSAATWRPAKGGR
jgi:predicted DNA-binding transcriptional regulator AlpA